MNTSTKATMLIENTAGATVARHITIVKFTENTDSVTLYYKSKGARKVQGYKISKKDTQLALANSWQSINGMTETKRGTFMYGEFTIFDSSNFSNAKKQLKNISYIHQDEKETTLPPHLAKLFA